MVKSSGFIQMCKNTCPTYWANGVQCSEMEDAQNKAFMEIELLEYNGLL